MRGVRRLVSTLCFVLALVLGFLIAVGLSGCEQRSAGTAPVVASRAVASAPWVPIPVPATREPMPSRADLDAGARLAVQGNGAAPACMACHDRGSASDLTTRVRAAVAAQRRTEGPTIGASQGQEGGHAGQGAQDGHDHADLEAPRLAGLGAAYLRRQLDAYADGGRPHPVMTPIAQSLLADQRRQLAAYFATLVPTPLAPPPAPSRPLAPDTAAVRLAWTGDESRQLPACANCHGRDGSGQADQIPPLAGQPAAYLEAALQAWRSGRRTTDASGSMPRIAQALRSGETQALARWYANLPVPPSAAGRAPAFVPAREPLSSGPTTRTRPLMEDGRVPSTSRGATAVSAGADERGSSGAEGASGAR